MPQAIQHHRQNRVAIASDAVGKDGIVAGMGGVGFGEDQVQADRAGALQAVQQRRVHRPPPGPAAQCVDAGVVDRDDQNVGRDGAPGPGDGAVIQDLVDTSQTVEPAEQGGQ